MALQVYRNPRFHRREHAAQTVGVLVVLALVLAGVLGLAGGTGPLNTVTSGDGPLEVRFERILHREADHGMTVTVDGQAVSGNTVDIEVAAGWLDTVDVGGVTPEPAEQVRTADGVLLRLSTEPGAPLTVRVEYRVNHLGGFYGWVRVPGGQVSFGQFVLP